MFIFAVMKGTTNAIHEVTQLSEKDCFYIADRHKSEFTYPIHSHEEFELNFIANAPGVKRIVGDSIEIIGEYDLVLITGKNLEHVWEQHECMSKDIREITIQFSSNLFSSFLNKNQFTSIQKMLWVAQKGISFPLSAIMSVYNRLEKLASDQDGFYAVMDFFIILHELSLHCDHVQTLSSSSFAKIGIQSDSRRIQKVQKFIAEHYKEEIRLTQLANLTSMTPVAFSRFFKLHTGRNLSDYIIDIRLGNTTRLLVDTNKSISEICYDSGFNNLSNFNRIFKKKKDCSPKDFRENYRKTKLII
jgi:YesN/AraC family two-component response regulator